MPFQTAIHTAILFGFFAFALWLLSRKVRTNAELMKLHLEGRNRLLDRFGDSEGFLTFARSEEGRALLEAPSLAREPKARPGLRLLQGALVAAPLGASLRYLGSNLVAQADLARGTFLDHRLLSEGHEYQLMGTLLLSAGAGLLLAGLLAWFADRQPRGH